ncbi:glycoside hydrolase domain-containing protein [Echinicola jeungdonensis]|uniref:Glycoside hydrolase domain-containing protein n=1 Tax=Echinicola jeungdonensis TaxID=709343 RepID=A0ABV5J0R7_9BACT
MGFYPVCPGTDQYVLGTPLFKKMTLHLENGKDVLINAPNNSAENQYINRLEINGENYSKNWLSHKQLMKGAVLDVTMGNSPNRNRERNRKISLFHYPMKNNIQIMDLKVKQHQKMENS